MRQSPGTHWLLSAYGDPWQAHVWPVGHALSSAHVSHVHAQPYFTKEQTPFTPASAHCESLEHEKDAPASMLHVPPGAGPRHCESFGRWFTGGTQPLDEPLDDPLPELLLDAPLEDPLPELPELPELLLDPPPEDPLPELPLDPPELLLDAPEPLLDPPEPLLDAPEPLLDASEPLLDALLAPLAPELLLDATVLSPPASLSTAVS